MQFIAIAKDGTTTIEFTDAEAHAIRDVLAASSDDTAWTLQRLLSHAHGDAKKG
jgi:hypothetical protein